MPAVKPLIKILAGSRRRLTMLAVALTVAMFAVAYLLWWLQIARSVEAGLDQWAQQMTARGWTIQTGARATEGFPLTLRVRLESPAITDPSGNSWQGPPLQFWVNPLTPTHPHLSAPGKHHLTLAGHPPAELNAGRAELEITLVPSGQEQATLTLANVVLEDLSLGQLSLNVERLAAPAQPEIGNVPASLQLSLALSTLAFPDDPRLALGHVLDSAKLDARLLGPLPSGPLKEALPTWRGNGGAVEINGLSVDWHPVKLSAKGTLALDDQLQPLLASTLTIRGLFEAVDALSASGLIHPKQANILKIALGLMTRPAADGALELTVPLTVQDQTVALGPANLAKIPIIVW